MKNMNKKTAIIALASSIVLAACGGSDDSSGSPTSTTSINAYTVEGSGVAVNGIVPVNSGVNDGAFTVNWNVSSSDPYNVRLYVSNDAVLSNDDVQFFSQNCGTMSAIYACNRVGSFNCSFNNQNRIACSEVGAGNLTTFLQALPQQVYLIMRACNGLFDSCKEQAIAVELQ